MSVLLSNVGPQQTAASTPIVAQVDPTAGGPINRNLDVGQFWINSLTQEVFVLAGFTNGQAVWQGNAGGGTGSFSSLVVSPGPTTITGQFRVTGNVDEPNVIELNANGGTTETILIQSTQGTGAGSVELHSVSGGIEVSTAATAPNGNMTISTDGGGTLSIGSTGDTGTNDLLVNLNGGVSSVLLINNALGTNNAQNASPAIALTAPAGGIALNAEKDFFIVAEDSSTMEVSVGDLTLLADTGNIDITATAGKINFTTGGGIDWQITGDVDLDVTGAISLDSTLASNFTVTGATQDLTLSSAGGSVNVTATETDAQAIFINATTGGIEETAAGVILISSTDTTGSDVTIQANGAAAGVLIQATDTGGNVTIKPGGSLEMAGTATVTTIDLGNITPTVNRTTTIAGAAVASAHTDLVSIADGGANTNASAKKQVTIATGNNLLGTTEVDIATGTALTGTHTVLISTGTGGGTKKIEMGNVDAGTTINEYGTVNINTSTSTGTTTIGNAGAGGAIALTTNTSVSIDSKTNSHMTVTGAAADLTLSSSGGSVNVTASEAAADAIVANASAGGFQVDGVLASHVTVTGAAADLTVSSVGGSVNMTASEAAADAIVVNASAGGFQIDGILASHVTVTGAAADLNLNATGGSVNVTATEAVTDAVVINASGAGAAVQIKATDALGSILLTTGAGAGVGGLISVANNTVAATAGPSATVSVTNNARVGVVTFAGYTQAASATLVVTLSNSFIAAGSAILATVTNGGTNAANMFIERIDSITTAGQAVITIVNNGAAALNGNMVLTFWVLS